MADHETQKDVINVRNAFVPAKDCVLVSADYHQLELRIIAHLADDDALIASICASTDIFKTMAAQWWGVEEGSVLPAMRNKVFDLSHTF